jgi:hypothetical protein
MIFDFLKKKPFIKRHKVHYINEGNNNIWLPIDFPWKIETFIVLNKPIEDEDTAKEVVVSTTFKTKKHDIHKGFGETATFPIENGKSNKNKEYIHFSNYYEKGFKEALEGHQKNCLKILEESR